MHGSITPWVAGAAMLALLLWLGFWQLDRADEKRALEAAFAAARAAPPEIVTRAATLAELPRFTPVLLEGRFVPDRQALLDAQVHEGTAGYRVWTPLEFDGGEWVLVDRGWVAATADRAQLPIITVGDDRRRVTGLVAPLPRPGLRLGEPDPTEGEWPRRLVWPDAETLARIWQRPLVPALVLLSPETPDGFVREWDPVAHMPPARHVGYAVTWFTLAFTLVVIALVLTSRKRRDD